MAAQKGNWKLPLIIFLFIIIVVVSVLLIGAIRRPVAYTGQVTQTTPPKPSVSAYISRQDMLYYNNAKSLLPYDILTYSTSNVSSLNVSIDLFQYAIPQNFYYLNFTNECYRCSSTSIENFPSSTISDIANDLTEYRLMNGPQDLQEVSISNLLSIKNNSVLIIINGLMPYQMFSSNDGLMAKLLTKNITVLYVGGNFSDVLFPGSLPVLASGSSQFSVPSNLITSSQITGYPNSTFSSEFFFKNSTFSFSGGKEYGIIPYTSLYKGTVIAFPNYLNTWSSPNDSASDISKAIDSLFWIPKDAYANDQIQITQNQINRTVSNETGFILNVPYPSNGGSTSTAFALANQLNKANGKIFVSGSIIFLNSSGVQKSAIIRQILNFTPRYSINGSISIPAMTIPNQTILIGSSVFSFSLTNQTFPLYNSHLEIYNMTYGEITSRPVPYVNNYTNGSVLENPESFYLAPGNYIIEYGSFYNKEYAAALFAVSPISAGISVLESSVAKGIFVFHVSSENVGLTNIPYSINMNGSYVQNGVVSNGTIIYSIPGGGSSVPKGYLAFHLMILNQKSTVIYNNGAKKVGPSIVQFSNDDIIIGVVIFIVVILMLLRAPVKDEFFIDVPHLSAQRGKLIKLKPDELVNIFGRMNVHYRWKFMPLNTEEFKIGMASIIKYDNVPVNLTYNNIVYILDELRKNNYLVMADNLYAPSEWVDQSKHDIDYLAAFKKIRIHLVTHGYIFSDLDLSKLADIVATKKDDRYYIVIYSNTSSFRKVPVYKDAKTYLIFLNDYEMEDFRYNLYNSKTVDALELRMYIDDGYVVLVDADNMGKAFR